MFTNVLKEWAVSIFKVESLHLFNSHILIGGNEIFIVIWLMVGHMTE
jgi:hypothetical protein